MVVMYAHALVLAGHITEETRIILERIVYELPKVFKGDISNSMPIAMARMSLAQVLSQMGVEPEEQKKYVAHRGFAYGG